MVHGNGGNAALTSITLPTTSEVVEQGKAILDGGATKTLGSVQKIMELNKKSHGDSGLASLHLADRPILASAMGLPTNACPLQH